MSCFLFVILSTHIDTRTVTLVALSMNYARSCKVLVVTRYARDSTNLIFKRKEKSTDIKVIYKLQS